MVPVGNKFNITFSSFSHFFKKIEFKIEVIFEEIYDYVLETSKEF